MVARDVGAHQLRSVGLVSVVVGQEGRLGRHPGGYYGTLPAWTDTSLPHLLIARDMLGQVQTLVPYSRTGLN